jgi:streptomycin 6-kinase
VLVESVWRAQGRPCSERVIETALACAVCRAGAFDPERAVLAHGDAHAGNLLAADEGRTVFKFVDPEGLFVEPAYDLSAPMRDWGAELLGGDALRLGRRRRDRLAQLTGLDPEAIWQWGLLERVSTGLHLLELGWEEEAHEYLSVAEAWAAD